MKTLHLVGFAAALALCGTAHATFNVDDEGFNVTNDGSLVVLEVPQSDLSNQSPQGHFDWISGVQIPGYNGIPDGDLPSGYPTSLPEIDGEDKNDIFLQNDSANPSDEYVLPAGCFFYVSVHFGGTNSLWYVEGSDAMPFVVPGQDSDGNGLSNVRIFKAKNVEGVPDGGSTLVMLGASLLLVPLRRVLRRK